MQLTDYHAKYYAHELTKRCPSDSVEKLAASLIDAQVPEVARGLRPRMPDGKLGRSPWVAIVERSRKSGKFTLRFVKLRSREYRELKRRSQDVGTVGRTSAREYGWL